MWERIRELLNGTEGALGLELAAGIALFLPGLIVPVFGKIFVDDILIGTKYDWLPWLLGAMALGALINGLLSTGFKVWLGYVKRRGCPFENRAGWRGIC